MQRRLFNMGLIIITAHALSAQDTLALWSFDNNSNEPQLFTFDNSGRKIENTTSAFPVFRTSCSSAPCFPPNPPFYVGGGMSKGAFWHTSISTLGYESIRLSSVQRSSLDRPKDWVIELSLDGGDFEEIRKYTVSNIFTDGFLSISMPAKYANQRAVFIQWRVNSDTAVNGTDVDGTNNSAIDDVLVTARVAMSTSVSDEEAAKYGAELITTADGYLISLQRTPYEINVYDIHGRLINRQLSRQQDSFIRIENGTPGVHLVQVKSGNFVKVWRVLHLH